MSQSEEEEEDSVHVRLSRTGEDFALVNDLPEKLWKEAAEMYKNHHDDDREPESEQKGLLWSVQGYLRETGDVDPAVSTVWSERRHAEEEEEIKDPKEEMEEDTGWKPQPPKLPMLDDALPEDALLQKLLATYYWCGYYGAKYEAMRSDQR